MGFSKHRPTGNFIEYGSQILSAVALTSSVHLEVTW